jgi:hypothetical protein
MNPALIALAAGRIVIGAGLLAKPTAAAAPWVGRDATRAGTRVFARALGARDLVLGLQTFDAVRRGGDPRPLLVAGAVVDLADGWATFADQRRLPRRARVLAGGVACAAAAGELALVTRTGPSRSGSPTPP